MRAALALTVFGVVFLIALVTIQVIDTLRLVVVAMGG